MKSKESDKRKKELMRRHKMDKPIELTEKTFKEEVGGHPLVVVDCWAPWCAPCHMIAPVIEELARDYAGKIVFGKLNVDENQSVAREYGIMSIPALLVLKNGEHIDTIIGAMPRQMLEPKIIQHLNEGV
jgi:thioredoxin 1